MTVVTFNGNDDGTGRVNRPRTITVACIGARDHTGKHVAKYRGNRWFFWSDEEGEQDG